MRFSWRGACGGRSISASAVGLFVAVRTFRAPSSSRAGRRKQTGARSNDTPALAGRPETSSKLTGLVPMLKKIRIDQLRLGMHLHGLCGAWLDHPLWRTRFVIREVRHLEQLRAGGVSECWIDTAKGLDIDQGPELEQATVSESPLVQTGDREAAIFTSPVRNSLEEEGPYAEALYALGKQTVVELFDQARMGRAIDTGRAVAFVDEIAASVRRNNAALVNLVRIKSHDEYTFVHSVAVATLMVALAQRMGQDEAETRQAGLAGLLHDIGKALIPLDVLNKPGESTEAKYGLMKPHPRMGHELLLQNGGAGDAVLDVCLHHHERTDGNGYPDACSGAALSVPVRMAAVCDVYDAITPTVPTKTVGGLRK